MYKHSISSYYTAKFIINKLRHTVIIKVLYEAWKLKYAIYFFFLCTPGERYEMHMFLPLLQEWQLAIQFGFSNVRLDLSELGL